jgi:hypothetical protein
MGAKIGLECVASRNSNTYASPVWVTIGIARDVKVGFTKGEGDVSKRGGGGFKMVRGTLTDLPVTMQIVKDTADANWLALRLACVSRTPIDFAFTDQAIANSGATGYRAIYEVMKFEDGEPLDGAAMTDVELKPTDPSLMAGGQNPGIYTT